MMGFPWGKYRACFWFMAGYDPRAIKNAVASYRRLYGNPDFDWWFRFDVGE